MAGNVLCCPACAAGISDVEEDSCGKNQDHTCGTQDNDPARYKASPLRQDGRIGEGRQIAPLLPQEPFCGRSRHVAIIGACICVASRAVRVQAFWIRQPARLLTFRR